MKFVHKIANSGFLLLAGLALFPLVLISIYNYPSADDFCHISRLMEDDFWPLQVKRYLIWTGRFVSTFFLTGYFLLAKNFEGYWFFSILFLGIYAHAVYRFFAAAFPDQTRQEIIRIAAAVYVLTLFGMPSLVQGVYWLTGSLTYFLPSSLVLYGCAYLLKNGAPKRILPFVTLSLIAIWITGANETSLLHWLGILAGGIAWIMYQRKSPSKQLIALFVLSLSVAMFSLLAPGNGERAGEIHNSGDFWFSLVNSLITAVWYIKRWLTETPVLPCVLLFIPMGMKWAKSQKPALFQVPLFALLLLVGGLYWATFFPGYLGLGGPPPQRTINLGYFVFLIGGLLCLQSAIYFYLEKMNGRLYSPPLALKLVLVGIIGLFFLLPNNISTAYTDLFSGNARAYYAEIKEREQLLPKCEEACLLPKYEQQPPTIYFDDITKNPDDWRNRCFAPVYGKKTVQRK